MNLEYGPEFDELAMCFKYLELDIKYICIEENKLRLDNEGKTIATLLTSMNEHFDKELFDAECITLIQKIAKMNINAFKTFYSNLAKTKNTCNENNSEEAKLPFYANKKSMSIIDIYLFARTYRFLYSNTFDASVMEYFEILNKMMHEKLNTRLFTDFEYLDIRAGKIVQIHEHPEADKLFVETVLFNEQKVIVSGLREHFKKEDLLNRHFLFLVNLKKNKLKGVVSEGMILCAKNEKLEVLESPVEMPNASVSTKGHVVIREVTKSILDSGKDKFKNIMKNLAVKDHYLCYNGEVLNMQGKETKVGISDAIVS